jgi:hypothetical protein
MAEVQSVRQLPAEFIEALGKTYADELTKTVGGLKTIDVSKLYGPQFVAGPGAFTTQAEQLAGGLGGYQQYLQAAQAATGPQAYQQYMSPYQQDVIQSTLQEFDVQAQRGLPGLRAQQVAQGAFGQGRGAVQEAVYQSESDRNRAALQAQLLQQGFGQAQQLSQQQFLNQMNLAQAAPAAVGTQIAGLTALGSQQEARQQAELEAQRQLAYQQAYQPYQATQALGQGVMGLISGYPAQTTQTITPSPSPLSTALGTASTLAGIYKLYGQGTQAFEDFNMSRILRRPMFRKGGQVMDGVMSLASGGRAKYQEAGRVSIEDLTRDDPYLKEIYDIAQAGYGRDIQQERSDVLANLLIRGGLGLVAGEGAGKGTLGAIATAFQKPTEQALTEMSALKQDPAKMLVAKTAIEQKGQERLQRIKNQETLMEAYKEARVILGSDASQEEINELAKTIQQEKSLGVGERFKQGVTQGNIEIIAKQSKVDLPSAKVIFDLQQNQEKIKEVTGLELGPNNAVIYGQRIKGRLDYSSEARNAPDGIYYDPDNRTFIKVQSGGFQIIPNPLINVKETSEIPNTETKEVEKNVPKRLTRKQRRDARRSPEVEEITGPKRLTRFEKRQDVMGG